MMMMMMKGQQQVLLLLLTLLVSSFLHNNIASSFVIVLPQQQINSKRGTTSTAATSLFVVSSSSNDEHEVVKKNNEINDNNNDNILHLPLTDTTTTTTTNIINNRRSLLLSAVITTTTTASFVSSFQQPQPALADETTKGKKIVVFGGSGYVGSYVIDLLVKQGYDVTSVSRSSVDTQKSKIINNLGSLPLSVKYVSMDASKDDFGTVLNDATAVISCIGVIGGTNQRSGNGAVNIRITKESKKAGIPKIVYIGFASDLANGPAKFILGDYIKGKSEAETEILKEYNGSSSSNNDSSSYSYLIVKPSIIAGSPPGEIRPPGPPGVTPAQVEAVAKAVVAGATGAITGIIDGNTEISKLLL